MQYVGTQETLCTCVVEFLSLDLYWVSPASTDVVVDRTTCIRSILFSSKGKYELPCSESAHTGGVCFRPQPIVGLKNHTLFRPRGTGSAQGSRGLCPFSFTAVLRVCIPANKNSNTRCPGMQLQNRTWSA